MVVGLPLALLLAGEAEWQADRSADSTTAVELRGQEDPFRGLWTRYERRQEGDPLRFWYFHGDGKGLYRYGRVGLANTHSYDYSYECPQPQRCQLSLRFRKSGSTLETQATLTQDGGGQQTLRFADDPYEPGARYRRVESDLDFTAVASAWTGPARDGQLGDRIWIDYRNYATGGAGFAMYQLSASAIDGRGVGWFHRGDFDDWSTESLTYRVVGDQIELFFDLREEPNVTRFRLDEGAQGRVLELESDPRDFWATHRYSDGGRSFGAAAFAPVLALPVVTREEKRSLD